MRETKYSLSLFGSRSHPLSRRLIAHAWIPAAKGEEMEGGREGGRRRRGGGSGGDAMAGERRDLVICGASRRNCFQKMIISLERLSRITYVSHSL